MTNKLQGVSDFSYTGHTGLGDFHDMPRQELPPPHLAQVFRKMTVSFQDESG